MAEPPTQVASQGAEPLVLVLPDGTRVPVKGQLTIGRGEDADVQIADRTVSRIHARILPGPAGPTIEDAGSRFGTLLSGSLLTSPTPLRAGAKVRLGDVVISVDDARPAAKAPRRTAVPEAASDRGPGETLVVPIDATLMGLRAPGPSGGPGASPRPRVRSGYALKRLGAEQGEERFVLRDLRGGGFVRMGAADAELFELLDGKRTVGELLVEAQRRIGPEGPGRLAALIADLAERGLLDGIDATPAPAEETTLQRLFKPRERSWDWVPDYFERAYHHWGRLFFSPLAVTFLALFALAGFGGFTYLIGSRYGTPFVVANRLIIGGAVFIAGRFFIAALHEVSHGLALAHYGRRAVRAGLRLVLIFPYAFVDTSEAYFESRAHRIVISAAGPASDLTLGALFSFACAVCPKGSVIGEVFFQLAFGAYIGAFFNLNPFLDRDGYNILVDFLREPRLRERARRQLRSKLTGESTGDQGSPVLARYAVAGVIWSLLGAAGVIIFSRRYVKPLEKLAPHWLVLAVFVMFFILLLVPVVVQLVVPLVRRARFGAPEVNRVIR